MAVRISIAGLAALASLLMVPAQRAGAQLNWEGQSGIFLNPLATTTEAGKVEASTHRINLESAGNIETYNFAVGLRHGVELGYTRIDTDAAGVFKQNVLHAKWSFYKGTEALPTAAVWATHRDLVGGSSIEDFGLIATKVYKAGSYPVVVDLGLRSTQSLGVGLFGKSHDRKLKWEGSAAVFVAKNLAIGGEAKEQIGGRTWTDFAVRYIVSDTVNIDAGLANFAPGLNKQFAIAINFKH